jgi:hypothetical protein
MRFLLLFPLGTSRNCQAARSFSLALRQLGHAAHVFTREVTRVVSGETAALSRNEEHVRRLKDELGDEQVSCLHSYLSVRPMRQEALLLATDHAIVEAFSRAYRPDAIFCVDNDVVAEPGLKEHALKGASHAALLTLRVPPGEMWHVVLPDGQALPLRRGDKMSMIELLRERVLPLLDAERSYHRLHELLDEHGQWLGTLTGEYAQGAAVLPPPQRPTGKATPIVVQTAKPETADKKAAEAVASVKDGVKAGGNIEVAGEIESVKDGDVVIGPALWIKGWIDAGAPGLKSMAVRINDSTHRCDFGAVRGELVEKLRRPGIVNFELSAPVTGEGSQLHVQVLLQFKDGTELPWRQLSLWASDTVPQHYKSPVLTGEVQWAFGESSTTSGTLDAEGYPIRSIQALQDGQMLGEWTCADAEQSNVAFHIPLGVDTRPTRPIHLWVRLADWPAVCWQRHVPAPGSEATAALELMEPQEGQVVHAEQLVLHAPGNGPLRIRLNGAAVEPEQNSGGAGKLTVPVGHAANDLLLEVSDEAGAYVSRRLWRHLDTPLIGSRRNAIAVGTEPARPPQLPLAQEGPRHVLLIRKAAAPTDELYVLAPLQAWINQGTIRLTVVDLDAQVSEAQQADALLEPGTVVIVSRYVSDEWIRALTRRKPLLGPIFYLMDDDVAAAEDTRWLPANYRERMAKVAHGEFQTMVSLCDRFIVTSEFLARRFRSFKTDLLEPPYLPGPRSMEHFEHSQEFVIAYHGTLAHRDDVAAIAPALRHVHDRLPSVKIQIVMGKQVPAFLKRLPRVEVVPAMPWQEYKAFAETSRAHVALAPVLRTPYNLGKSVIKIHDIAALGAVGVYSKGEPYTKYVRNGVDGLLLENDPLMWQKALHWLATNPHSTKQMAIAGQALAARVGALRRTQQYWATQLGLELDAAPAISDTTIPTAPTEEATAHV